MSGLTEAEHVAKIGPELLPIFSRLAATIHHQDVVYGAFSDSVPNVRLGIACLEDEVAEALESWRDERRAPAWPETGLEVFHVAAVAVRLFRDIERKPADEETKP